MKTDLDDAIAAVAAKLRASTVRVHDEGGRGSGSGVLWDADGTIVTNAHVVRGASATIETADGTKRRARLLRRDAARDLATLRVDAGGLEALVPATVRDSTTVVPGELAIAAGNPLGFVGAVTAGLVHRCNARWVLADVRLAPGNSGGPLADAEGRVIGINSMIAHGRALAIPSAAVSAFVTANEAATGGRRLGVRLAPVRIARDATALLVVEIEPGSVAERSGLVLGDAILNAMPLSAASTLEILRGGARIDVPLAWTRGAEDARAA